jgi:hypothetical protein
MSGFWFLAVVALVAGSILAAVAARGLRRETEALAADAGDLAALRADARALGEAAERLRRRVATTGASRHDG